MQINPRYEGEPILRMDVREPDPSVAALRQRRRLGDLLTGFDDEQWAATSRCEGWSARDVVAHLVSTNQFWAMSIGAGRNGAPTTFLSSFDPVASPAQMVEATRDEPAVQVLGRYLETVESMATALEGMDDSAWDQPAEAPPGHVAIHAVLAHALWDGWIHERDILLPQGLSQAVEDDEVVTCLRYVAALGPGFLASTGSTRRGTLVVEASDPASRAVIEAGPTVVVHDGLVPDDTPTLRGAAVDLIEGLSFRAPLDHQLPDEHAWLIQGLDAVFDRA